MSKKGVNTISRLPFVLNETYLLAQMYWSPVSCKLYVSLFVRLYFDAAVNFDSQIPDPVKYAFVRVDTGTVMGAMHIKFDDTCRSVDLCFKDTVNSFTVLKKLQGVVSRASLELFPLKFSCILCVIVSCFVFAHFSQPTYLLVVFVPFFCMC